MTTSCLRIESCTVQFCSHLEVFVSALHICPEVAIEQDVLPIFPFIRRCWLRTWLLISRSGLAKCCRFLLGATTSSRSWHVNRLCRAVQISQSSSDLKKSGNPPLASKSQAPAQSLPALSSASEHFHMHQLRTSCRGKVAKSSVFTLSLPTSWSADSYRTHSEKLLSAFASPTCRNIWSLATALWLAV